MTICITVYTVILELQEWFSFITKDSFPTKKNGLIAPQFDTGVHPHPAQNQSMAKAKQTLETERLKWCLPAIINAIMPTIKASAGIVIYDDRKRSQWEICIVKETCTKTFFIWKHLNLWGFSQTLPLIGSNTRTISGTLVSCQGTPFRRFIDCSISFITSLGIVVYGNTDGRDGTIVEVIVRNVILHRPTPMPTHGLVFWMPLTETRILCTGGWILGRS